jgi:hypothetical protein
LDTAGRCRIDEDPFITIRIILIVVASRERVNCPIILMQRTRPEVGEFNSGADEMCFTDPRSLLVGQNYRDDMPS